MKKCAICDKEITEASALLIHSECLPKNGSGKITNRQHIASLPNEQLFTALYEVYVDKMTELSITSCEDIDECAELALGELSDWLGCEYTGEYERYEIKGE